MNDEKTTILIVDDNPENLDVLFDLLSGKGFELLFAIDGASALQRAEIAELDLILLDIMMPGMDGFEVCRRLQANAATCRIPIVFMTALTDTANKIKGFEAGAVDYITKPIEAEEVLVRVNTHLKMQRLQHELHVKNANLQAVNTDLQATLEREKELNALKSRFVSIASHEFRSPLALIQLAASVLKRYRDRMSEEKKVKHLNVIEGAVEEMTGILNNVLMLTKIEAGSVQFSPEPLDIEEFCQPILDKFTLMSAATHTIAFSGNGERVQAVADPQLLQSILSNLLSNALKYSPDGGRIQVNLSRNATAFELSVQDQGLGISQEDQQHLFTAFQRGKNVGDIKGSGLGLSIVKQFVDLHGGTITVASEVQQGSTFTVTLPYQLIDCQENNYTS